MLIEPKGGKPRGFETLMMEREADRNFARRLGKLRRHRRWIFVGTGLCALAAMVLSHFLPKIYRATTYVLVSESKIATAPEAQAGREVLLSYVPLSWQMWLLPTYLPFIDNDTLISEVIKNFHLDRAPYRLTPRRFRESGYLVVKNPKSTRLIEIQVEFPDPRLVSDIANFLAQRAMEFNNELNASDTLATQKVLKQRLDEAASHLAERESKRLQVREKAEIENKEQELSILLDQKKQASMQLETIRLSLAQNESRAKFLEEALRGQRQSPELRKNTGPDHFAERTTDQQDLSAQGSSAATQAILNTTREAARSQFVNSSADVTAERAGLQAATTTLAQINSEISHLLAQVTKSRSEIEGVDRDYNLAREAYESANRDYRNASVTVSEKSVNLRQVAPALVPERPVRPRILFNVLLAALLGFILLSGAAMAVESFREMQGADIHLVGEDEPVSVRRP